MYNTEVRSNTSGGMGGGIYNHYNITMTEPLKMTSVPVSPLPHLRSEVCCTKSGKKNRYNKALITFCVVRALIVYYSDR